jgi:hypothetical protein
MQTSDQVRNSQTGNLTILPLLPSSELPLALAWYRNNDPGRGQLEEFVRGVFHKAYDADINEFYPTLVGLRAGLEIKAVAGIRAGGPADFFSEQYLDRPADKMLAALLKRPVQRRTVVEIGNLAVTTPGEARWLYAALMAFLWEAGFDWILCTAVTPLYHGFRRMGFEPIVLGAADPERLGDKAHLWGSYYQQRAQVCCGSICRGFEKLSVVIGAKQTHLQRLWSHARTSGARFRSETWGAVRELA